MLQPKISVIIPAYNKAQFIGRTLDSILRQSYTNYEVIVQDGGSIDGTYEIVSRYAKRYPKIFRIESKDDGGQTNAINIGFGKAKGEIVTYINADDVYKADAFSEVARQYHNNPQAIWFVGQGTVIDNKGREIAKFATCYKNMCLSLNHKSLLLILNYMMQPSVFLTKQAYQKYGPFNGMGNGVVMEYGLWLKLSKVAMPVVIKKTLSAFRISEGSTSSISYKKILEEDESVLKKYTKNRFILALHKFNNLLRVVTIRALNP
jgi:glycosyltransferase involved in cell wall biosynthesis